MRSSKAVAQGACITKVDISRNCTAYAITKCYFGTCNFGIV